MTGIPIYNSNNNGCTGSSALYLAKQLVDAGQSDCVMALGFEKMERGTLGMKYYDRAHPADKLYEVVDKLDGFTSSAPSAQPFGNAGEEHMRKYGSKPEHFAKISQKSYEHSLNNPYAQFQQSYTLQEILNSPQIHRVLTKLQCCPTSDGSACVILANEDFVRRHKLENQAVEILAMEMSTDLDSSFNSGSSMILAGYDMSKNAARKAFSRTNYKPSDVDVVELHDCFSTNELMTYEALGLCEEGKGHELVERGDNTYGGKYVINPSGGLTSKGNPLGATGISQCTELCWQLRGIAEKRQMKGAKLALQHNIGLGGACVVSIYEMGFKNGVVKSKL
jgi:sterol carrier protein 2